MPHRSAYARARILRQVEIAKLLAAEPGLTRAELARRLCLSERQVQLYLSLMAHERYVVTATVKLTRHRGYRLEPVSMEIL